MTFVFILFLCNLFLLFNLYLYYLYNQSQIGFLVFRKLYQCINP